MGGKVGNIILVPGPLHLFWTTGVYYLWELSKKYNVVLIVDEVYLNDELFHKVVTLAGALEVIYIPRKNVFNIPCTGHLRRRWFCARVFKNIVRRYRPKFVLQHERDYIENSYLFHWCKKIDKECCRITYQNGKDSVSNWEGEFRGTRLFEAEKISRKYHLPRFVALPWYDLLVSMKYILDYRIIPLVMLQKQFHPAINVYTGSIAEGRKDDLRDFHLVYTEVERDAMANKRVDEDKLFMIQHPLRACGKECNEIIYGEEEGNLVLILPTYGFMSLLKEADGLNDDEVEDKVSEQWIAALDVLSVKFPGYRFVWKLHPADKNNPSWQRIIDRVRKSYSDLHVISPIDKAEKWILKSKVIVSDVTSSMWWASFTDKIVISLDLFGYPGGDEMKYFKDIYYFNDLDKLGSCQFMCGRAQEGGSGNPQTLSGFMEGLQSAISD